MPDDNEQSDMADQDVRTEASEIQFLFPENEEKIMNATIKAFESGSLTPLIKEELRCTIQSRRLAAGKGELQLEEFKKPTKRKLVTEEEKRRAQTRRLQNREAAQRFRQRQKDVASYLTDKIKRLERSSANLLSDMQRLRDERDELKTMLHDHLVVCTNNIPIPAISCTNIQQFLQQCANPPTSSTNFSMAESRCTTSSDSTSSVFFPGEITCVQNEHLAFGSLLQGLEANTIEITEDNSSMIYDFTEAPEMGQEMVIGGTDLPESEYPDDHRLDSCSSLETVSNYSPVSPDSYSPGDSASDLTSSLVATFSMVHTNPFCYQAPETDYLTDDIFLLDDTTS